MYSRRSEEEAGRLGIETVERRGVPSLAGMVEVARGPFRVAGTRNRLYAETTVGRWSRC